MREVVVVTGSGGPAGVAVIKELQRLGHRAIGVDSSSDAVGIRLADVGGVIPTADDPCLSFTLSGFAHLHHATALISTIPAEMGALDSIDIPHWFASPATINLCCDKLAFYGACSVAGVPVPQTTTDMSGADVPGPWVAKPNNGSGSRDVHFVDDLDEILGFWHTDFIMQTRLTGREFTADVLVWHDGTIVVAVPRWRNKTRGGISTNGETFAHTDLINKLQHLMSTLHYTGICNVQGFIDGDDINFIEVNPRFSGGLPLSLAAGADLVGQYLRGIHRLPLERHNIHYKKGVRMMRHFSEVFEGV